MTLQGFYATGTQAFAKGAAISVTLIALAVLGGFAVGIPGASLLFPPWSGVVFVALGIMTWVAARSTPRMSAPWRLGAAVVLVIGVVTFGEHIFGVNTGFDTLLFPRSLRQDVAHPGRPAPLMTFQFCLLGMCALLLPVSARRLVVLRDALLVTVATLSYFVLVAYLLRGPANMPARLSPVIGVLAVLTSVSMLIVGREGLLIGLVRDAGPAGVVARRLLPFPLLLPLATSLVRVGLQRVGWYDPVVGNTMLSALTILAAVGIVAVSAASIRRMDSLRSAAEEEVRQARDRLEMTVQARTEALKTSHRELEQRELQYRLLFAQSPQPLWVYDIETLRFLMVNSAATELYGYAIEEFLQMSVTDITPPEDLPKLATRTTFPVSGSTGLWRHRKKDGSFVWVESVGNTIEVAGKPARMVLVRDVTERKQLEEELALEHERYRALAAHLLRLQDQERLHLSREIHDTFGQELTGVKFQLQALASSTPSDRRTAPMLTALDEVMRKLREVAAHLRPPILDHFSLPDALEWLLEQHAERTGLKCAVQIDPVEIAVTDEIKMAVFRICQEALTNITRHAKASRVTVCLRCRDGALTLQIKDDGVGFDTARGSTNLGLLGMRERAEAIGGTLQIKSALGSGTEVTLSLAQHLVEAGNESPAA